MSGSRNPASEKVFYADSSFSADVTSESHPLRLVVADRPDGWLCAVVYPDTEESIMLAEFHEPDAAKRYLVDWARLVHGVSGPIEWLAGASLKDAIGVQRLTES